MKVNFITPTKLSILDLCSMGDSSKRGDENTLGLYDSGLKYSIALLLRDGVKIKIDVSNTNSYTFTTKVIEDNLTNKKKELIVIIDKDGQEIITGFAKNLGHNWLQWMSLRELWSNMLDEKGYVTEGDSYPDESQGTIITLEFNETNEFFKVWQDKALYINFQEPLFELSDTVSVLENPGGCVRIFKQNILVYEDKDTPSKFAYDVKYGEIDERRVLKDIYYVEQHISEAICRTKNEAFLRTIITKDFSYSESEFLSRNSGYYSASDLMHEVAQSVEEQFGEVKSFGWVMSKIRERRDCKISGKKIKTVEDSIWAYSTVVTVESTPISEAKEDSFQDKVNKLYNFKIDAEVKTAKLKGSKVVADKYEKCLIIDENFDIEKDFPKFVVEYLDLKETGNIIDSLANYICKLIKK
jgi:hypothetical protein